MPAVPLRPGTPARPTPSRKGTQDETDVVIPEETPTKPSRSTSSSHLKHDLSVQQDEEPSAPKQPEAKENEKPSKAVEEVVKPSKEAADLAGNEEKMPASPSFTKPGPSGIQPPSKGKATVQSTDASAAPVTPSKAEATKSDSTKRKPPGKLDITAAISKQKEQPPAATATPVEAGTPGKPQRAPSQTSSASKLPESPSVGSPAVKAAPRTLRLMQTPKAETPSTKEFPLPSVPPSAAAHKFPSRQPSVASINPPGTPSSEQVSISDNISMTSTSQSRANSPPPASSKVGSAPVRTKTKNQMKKERQERAKALEEEKAKTEEAVKPPVEEPAQEAIVSRKKKTKKEKEPKPAKPKASADNTPTASRPVSPGKQPVGEASAKPEAPISTTKESKPATPTRSTPTPQQGPAQAASAAEPSPPPTPTLTAAQLINELKASAPEIQKCIDNLFRISNSHHFKQAPQNVSHKDLLAGWKSDFNLKLTKEEVDALLTGKIPAVHRGGEGDRTFDRHMVTPSGAHLRALTKELESRFLELEKALREMPAEHRFRPSKPQNEMKLPAFDLEELKRKFENGNARGVSVMEQMVQDGSTMKKGAFLVDEASKYINEFVMPPATPPPSAGGQAQQQQQPRGVAPQQGAGAEGSSAQQQPQVPSVEIAERHLVEARRVAEEKENALKKIMKKNKRMLGLS